MLHPITKLRRREGVVDVPHATVQLVVLPTTVADLQEVVQNAENQRIAGKKLGEAHAGGRPAVGTDRHGGIVRCQRLRLGGELAVSLLKRNFIGRVGQGYSQDGVCPNGPGHEACLAGPIHMMFEVLGQVSRIADGGTHQAILPQSLDEMMPEHLAVPETDHQELGGDAVGRQKQGKGEFLDGAGHVSGDEGEPQPVGVTIGQDNLAELHAGHILRESSNSLEAIRRVEAVEEKFGGGPEPLGRDGPEGLKVMPQINVLGPIQGMTICLEPRGACDLRGSR